MPFAVGGGIKTIDEISQIISSGAEKVVINTAAIENEELVKEAAAVFGSQSIVISIDVKKNRHGSYIVYTHSGKKETKLDPLTIAIKMESCGAGEIIINSIDNDGTQQGYDIELIKRISDAVKIPVIALGGAGQMEDFLLDPEFGFEVVKPKGKTIYDTVAKIKVNEVLKRSNLTQVGSLPEVFKYKAAFHWSLISLKAKSKVSRFQWKQYTKEPASDWQLGKWWTQYPDSNVAAITGEISNLIVIDIDDESAFDLLEKHGIYLKRITTAVAKTHRGYQYFFNYHSAIKQRNFDGGEIRTDGHYVVIPPSVHPEGTQYTWEHSPFDVGIADIPESLIKFTSTNENAKSTITDNSVIPMGRRNNTLTSRAGSMRRPGMTEDKIFESLMTENNNRCKPPLPEKEVRNIAHSIGKHEPQETTTSNSDIQLVNLSTVQSEKVEFLWHPRIPLGKVTLIEGDPGVGKSWLTVAIATAVSLGRGLPDCESCEPGNVLILSAEDGLSDTIKPRLESFGANCKRISAPSEPFTLDQKGFNLLSQFIQKCSPRLVIIDPLVAYMGGKIDLHKANETRSIMSQMARLAERNKCSIVAVRHLTKGGKTKGIYRGLGSIDITAACRSVLLVGCDANNPNERGVVHIKSNLAKLAAPIGY
ncbi:AAA family ATPase, partial [candidate division KSB1 bacterium]|nr:AAA family ATPase [candidate division KSB1 bacterium]